MSGDNFVVNALIFVPPILGFVFSAIAAKTVAAAKLDGHPDLLSKQDSQKQGVTNILEMMNSISGIIAEGANEFLYAEYKYMAVYIFVFSIILFLCSMTQSVSVGIATTISFVVGGVTSILAGFIGMRIAVFTNVRTAHEAWKDVQSGFDVAIQGGSVMGLSLVALGVLNLWFLILFIKATFRLEEQTMFEAISGYGLGGSSIALFGRVGGGIYTKAADVGADLSGKVSNGLDEDDPRNPACIADNVGDNVGDIAGMGADLFGSFAESTCAAFVLASACDELKTSYAALMYPMLISSTGIVVGIITLLLVKYVYPVKELPDVEKALKGVLVISTVLMTPLAVVLSLLYLPATFKLHDGQEVNNWYCAVSILFGLWSGLIIGFVTEYYTSHSYKPVQEIAQTQKQAAATGIIYGLAVGYLSCIVPVICLGATILVGHSLAGMFGVALGALGMLGTMTMGLTIDAYGPISDNAGGIAEMSGMDKDVRKITDALDAAGNTTAAIGKGFAIGSAALVSLALFGAYTVRANVAIVDILNAWVFTGLLFGAMMPYAFAAWTMKSVGEAANDMVEECARQFPLILSNQAKPDYKTCIAISTQASLREMLAPGALVILSPLVTGVAFGKDATAGLLTGAMVSSVQLAISMSNSGGAWDNAKKWIEAGGDGSKEFAKGSEAHKNAVTGDTVGDPLKDTSGPALNIVMKLTAIISLVFGTFIDKFSNCEGGPFWLEATCK